MTYNIFGRTEAQFSWQDWRTQLQIPQVNMASGVLPIRGYKAKDSCGYEHWLVGFGMIRDSKA